MHTHLTHGEKYPFGAECSDRLRSYPVLKVLLLARTYLTYFPAVGHWTINLIIHTSKIMQRITLIENEVKGTEEILAEEKAGFRKGRSTVEQILQYRMLCEKMPPTPVQLVPQFY